MFPSFYFQNIVLQHNEFNGNDLLIFGMVLKNRKLNRKPGYDYSKIGGYFITICVKNRVHWFGEIQGNKMVLNELVYYTQKCWDDIPKHYPHIQLDGFVIMPDHIHGILRIMENSNKHNRNGGNDNVGNVIARNDIVGDKIVVGNNNYCSLRNDFNQNENDGIVWQTKWAKSISSAIRGFKIGVKKYCNENNIKNFVWQKSFHDIIVHNNIELENMREYIKLNPYRWNS